MRRAGPVARMNGTRFLRLFVGKFEEKASRCGYVGERILRELMRDSREHGEETEESFI